MLKAGIFEFKDITIIVYYLQKIGTKLKSNMI